MVGHGRRGIPLRVKLPATLAMVTAITLGAGSAAGLSREWEALERMALVAGNFTPPPYG